MQRQGFTLIELMVVMSIIAMLSSIVLASIHITRMKADDTVRIAEVSQMRDALSEYYGDYGHYPLLGSNFIPNCNWTQSLSWQITCINGSGVTNFYDLNSELAPYMKTLPKDPQWHGWLNYYCCNISYFVNSDGSDYDLIATLETDNPNMCKYKQYISHTGGYLWGSNSPGVGNSWCDPNNLNTQIWPENQYIYSDH